MGQYKVPQDVEAEDHILGPLTFKQFIYALIGAGWAFISFALFNKLIPLLLLVGVPPFLFFMMLAFFKSNGRDFEQLLISMVGYWGNTRKRVWRKDEIIETYRIEPRKIAAEQTQRNPTEVRSELDKLATLLDSRGWSRPQDANLINPSFTPESQDRIILPAARKEDIAAEAKPSDDIYDIADTPLAQSLDDMMRQASREVRDEALQRMRGGAAKQADEAVTPAAPVMPPPSAPPPSPSPAPVQAPAAVPAAAATTAPVAVTPAAITPAPPPPLQPIGPLQPPPASAEVTNPLAVDILETSVTGEEREPDGAAKTAAPETATPETAAPVMASTTTAVAATPPVIPANGVNILAKGQKVVFRHGEKR